jgi:hypothetical protein
VSRYQAGKEQPKGGLEVPSGTGFRPCYDL